MHREILHTNCSNIVIRVYQRHQQDVGELSHHGACEELLVPNRRKEEKLVVLLYRPDP